MSSQSYTNIFFYKIRVKWYVNKYVIKKPHFVQSGILYRSYNYFNYVINDTPYHCSALAAQ